MENKKKMIKRKIHVDTSHAQEAMMGEGGPVHKDDLRQEKKNSKKDK